MPYIEWECYESSMDIEVNVTMTMEMGIITKMETFLREIVICNFAELFPLCYYIAFTQYALRYLNIHTVIHQSGTKIYRQK